jgi:predicted Zn-dependent protease
LTREIAQRPDDADLRFRAGEIYLKAGEDGEGLRWLLSALAARPDHRATHRLLAQTYQRQGKAELAARHQRMAQQ